MKLAGPEPAAPSTDIPPIDDAPPADAAIDTPPADDKPFDDEPFDAGVEADEQSDPKKFIEQLTGKLGQSLRKYTEELGHPDFELEKFAVNSLLSATHTSEMDTEDQDDIIKKVKEAGNHDETNDSEEDKSEESDVDSSTADSVSDDFGGDMGDTSGAGAESSGEAVAEGKAEMTNLFVNPKKNDMFQPNSNNKLKESCWKGYKQLGMKEKDGKSVPNCVPINENESNNYMFWQNLKTIHHAAGELLKMNKEQIDSMVANGHAWAVDHIATSSDDIEEVYHFFEANLKENLNISDKSSIFDKINIKSKLQETFNQDDMSEPMTEPMVKPKEPAPLKTPNTEPPSIAPSRKNKPFLPMPNVKPDPKAINPLD